MRKFIVITMALALLLTLIPATAVFAATSGTATGSFNIGSVSPTASAIEVYSDAGLTTVAGSMTPQTIYYVKVTVTEPNTLNDIKELELKVYYDATAAHPLESTITTPHEQTYGQFTWTKSSGTWAVAAGTGASWEAVSASSVTPTMTDSTGDWVFAIKLGKTATETTGAAVWNMHAKVTDEADHTSGIYKNDLLVNWYGEVTVSTSTIDFGSVTLGSEYTSKYTGVSAGFVSNGDYASNVKSDATWHGSTYDATLDAAGTCSNPQEFAIKAYHSDNLGSAYLIDTIGVNCRLGSQTLETGDNITTGTFWIKINAVFAVDAYSGVITFTIVNN